MAAWGKPGAWAQDAEEKEALEMSKPKEEEAGDFPSLQMAMAKPKKKKEKMSLAEFNNGKYVGPGAKAKQTAQSTSSEKGLTTDELRMLPTGPRERTAEELERGTGLGGGFRGYGTRDREREGGNRDFRKKDSGFDSDEPSRADSSSHWGSSKGGSNSFRSERDRGDRDRDRDSERDGPSRADETEDWGAGKKFTPAPSSEKRFGGGGGFVESTHSRADESSNWGSQKSTERRGGFDSYREPEGGDRWARRGGGRSGFDFFQRDAAGGGPDGDRWSRREDNNISNDNIGGGERRRLVLQPRTAAPAENNNNINVTRSRASNPFGEARPREEVLAAKGQDWKKLDEDLDYHGRKDADGDGKGGSFNSRSSDDKTVRDWRKRDDNNEPATENSRAEETARTASGNEESEHDGSDDCRSIQTEKEVEQLKNDLSQKVHISQKSSNGNGNGYDRTARW